jgi:LysR family carnitine catabolism transcriptional activator
MDRRHLEQFVAVCRGGSMAAAAEEMHVSQPALSQAIKQLERELGCDLFQRLPRGVRLTAAGEALLGPAKQTLRDFATARASVDHVVGLRAGSLEIIALPGIVIDPLARLISEFRKRAPQVTLKIDQVEVSPAVVKAVLGGDAELGFMLDTQVHDQGLVQSNIGQQELVAVFPPPRRPAPETESATIKDLLLKGMIVGAEGTLSHRLAVAEMLHCSEPLKPVIQVDRRESALSLVLAGAGAALFPRAFGLIAESQGAVMKRLEPPLHRNIYMVRRAGQLSPAARLVEKLVTPPFDA